VSFFHDLFEVDCGGHDIPTEALIVPPWVIASALSCGPTTPSGSLICSAAGDIVLGRCGMREPAAAVGASLRAMVAAWWGGGGAPSRG